MIVDVIPESKTFNAKNFFSYSVPDELINSVTTGSVVEISFGKKNIRGVIIALKSDAEDSSGSFKIKPIISVRPEKITDQYIEIAKWISEYYLCSFGESISLFLPPEMKSPRPPKLQKNENNNELNKLNPVQKEIYLKLEQKLLAASKKPSLIYGVTGSGKTEIYLHLAKKTLALGKSVVLLVPEIVLTPQSIERFEEIFSGDVALLHSGLSKSEKYNCYKTFNTGEKRIIVGPRSALLVPNENIGLIIIDEEQEESYKQEQNPRYDAVAVAEKISQSLNALLVLGSATPRMETYYKANQGIYDLHTMSGRFNTLSLPLSEVVDLKNEIKKENYSSISERLSDAIKKTLENGQQSLLFLNRRGMSTFVSCRDCGHVVSCTNCDVPLVFHFDSSGNYFICHHCERKYQIPSICPACKSKRIKYFGSGVEKIESEISKLFPTARIKRVDSKILQNHKDYENFYQDFKNHKFDIVIGTQILAKGFDIPGVSLVGIISADVGLHLPHFRASEKIFRLITQVSGRSGRRDREGKTIIQTYWPDSAAIQFASRHDFGGFYASEIERRAENNYPPVSNIIRILSESNNRIRAKEKLVELAEVLKKQKIDFIGPGPCFFQKLNNKFRFQIIIKAKKLPDDRITEVFLQFPTLIWDVDVQNLL